MKTINPAWGKHDSCTLPGERTWIFMDNLFEELAQIFPDEYLHIGGDEADYCADHVSQWRAEGIKSGAAFMKKTAEIARKHGK